MTDKEYIKALEEERDDYYAFISAIAGSFGCEEGVDMRDFICSKLEELRKSASLGVELARNVMSDQTGKS